MGGGSGVGGPPEPPRPFCSGLIAEQPDAGLFFVDTGNAEKGERYGGVGAPLNPPQPLPRRLAGGFIYFPTTSRTEKEE